VPFPAPEICLFAVLFSSMIALASATCIGSFLSVAIPFRSVAIAAIVLLAIFLPSVGQKWFARIEGAFLRLALHTVASLVVLPLSTIVLRLCLLPWLRVPIPGIHDAFSYLLLADTFAHGRLSNPTPPMWISFETFHVNWLPTYHSMYPPAQGFALAIGQVLGHPWIGVLLSDAVMSAAIFWMLRAWVPARWALLGSALVGIKFGIASYWMNSYWGGAVAAIGGALVLGSVARIVKQQLRVRHAILLGLGLAILANSRPYEGFVFAIPAGIWLLVWFFRQAKTRNPLRPALYQVAAPLFAVLIATAVFMGYYNWRTTGNPLLLPHKLNTRTYHSVGMFLWQHATPEKQYRNEQFEEFYNDWERNNYRNTWADVRRVSWEKIQRYSSAYLWWGLLLLLPALPFALRDRKMRLPWITLAFGAFAVFSVIWSNAHYAAPFTCAIYLLIVQAMRHLRIMRKPYGLALSRAVVALLVLDVAANVRLHRCDPLPWTCEGDVSRFAVVEKLNQQPGKHLIIVRYQEELHNIHDEWVYNAADIDHAKIIWARELDRRQNQKLFHYYSDRRIWLVTPDDDNTYLAPYTPPGVPLLDSQ
jgi:hypothetical protein